MALKYEDVFRPGAFPEYTYISRKSAVSFLTSLVGPSKMGKTILCEKVIGLEKIVEVSGADFDENTDFWKLAASKVGLAYEGQFSSEKIIPDTRDKYGKKEVYALTKDKIIEYYKQEKLVMVIDDFHYAPPEKRMQIAQQLKDAIRRGFKAIVVSLPHRADEAIRQNADLSGRLSLINMEAWEVKDLKEIAKIGFAKLDIEIEDDIAEKIAIESLTSPQLMQYICLNICTILELSQSGEKRVCSDILETAYRYTTANFEYGDVVAFLKKGPNPRGKSRKHFKAKDGRSYDLYELIVKSIAENPPIMQLEFEDVQERIVKLLDDDSEKPKAQAIREHLTKLQELINGREDIFRVLDWKEGTLYILDPLFLFYLRWGGKKSAQ